MRFWIVKYGETVPFAPERQGGQLFRAGSIARALAKRGHDVTWWTGRFEHQTKSYLAPKNQEILSDPESDLSVRLIDSPGYKSNVSIARAIDHRIFRHRLRTEMRKAPKPDLIFVSFPIPEIAADCVHLGKQIGVPVVTDVRDLWPEILVDRLKDRFGFSPTPLINIYDRQICRTLHDTDAAYAITPDFLEWAQTKGSRSSEQRKNDRFFHLSSEKPDYSEDYCNAQRALWEGRGVDFSKFVYCWAGSLSPQKTLEEMLDAFEQLPDDVARQLQLVICGRGVLESRVQEIAKKCDHVLFVGFVPNDEVKGLYLNGDIGLLCYDDVQNFRSNYPNKFGEYLSCGLPILTTLTGPILENFPSEVVISTNGGLSKDIARTISQLIETPANPEVREVARKIHFEQFDSATILPRLCESLEDFTRNKL